MTKIKDFIGSDRGKDILTVLVVILVGLGSFGLGRLSKDNAGSGIKIEYPAQEIVQTASVLGAMDSAVTQAEASNFSQTSPLKPAKTSKPAAVGSTSSAGREFFASKIGHKYYSIGCSGGKTIKQENRIYFKTEAEAISAGFEKSASCK